MRFVVLQVECADSVADWRQQCVAIVGVDEVAFAVDCAQQIRELRFLSMSVPLSLPVVQIPRLQTKEEAATTSMQAGFVARVRGVDELEHREHHCLQ